VTEEKCVFNCVAPPPDEALIDVEMNIDAEGELQARETDGMHTRRVQGKAHQSCYAQWYERTYKVPFG
jgi:hypothetical protein